MPRQRRTAPSALPLRSWRGLAILGVALIGCVAAGISMSGVLAGPRTAASLAGGRTLARSGHAREALARHLQPVSPARDAEQIPHPRLSAPKPPAPLRVSGAAVTAIGDSVMLASAPALNHALPGISIDAVVSRQFYTGVQVIASLASQGRLRPIVVVALGTNGTVTGGEIKALLAGIGPGHRLVLVNTFEARPWEAGVNAALAAAARSHPQVVLVDWHDAIAGRPGMLRDGIHPGPAAAQMYAQLLAAGVRQAETARP
jgi:hypothetical protein